MVYWVALHQLFTGSALRPSDPPSRDARRRSAAPEHSYLPHKGLIGINYMLGFYDRSLVGFYKESQAVEGL